MRNLARLMIACENLGLVKAINVIENTRKSNNDVRKSQLIVNSIHAELMLCDTKKTK